MAKVKNSFIGRGNSKIAVPGSGSQSVGVTPRVTLTKSDSAKAVTPAGSGSLVQALNFGALHTKISGSANSSSWSGLLSTATSGASALSGGILSVGTFGFITKLLGLFGGSKSTPAAPTPFVMPASQVTTLNVAPPGASSSVSLGVRGGLNSGDQTVPAYQQSGTAATDNIAQSTQVVQIVKQALLTSSSLNDVISEI
jgi:hypothetical protein